MEQNSPSWTSRLVPSGTAVIAAQSAGADSDPALLLIGGATWSRDWWLDELCAGLVGAGLRVLRYDQRDTGESTLSPVGRPDYAGDDLAADAIAVLDAFGIEQATIAGLSMGGGVAQLLAVRHPDRVAGLVLLSTSPAHAVDRSLPGPTPEIAATFEVAVPDPDWSDRDAVVAWTVEAERPYAGPGHFDESDLREATGRTWDRTESMAAAANHILVAGQGEPVDLTAVRDFPVLVVHGSADPLFPVEHGQALATALAAPLLVLDGVGHQLPPRDTWPVLVKRIAEVAHQTAGTRGTPAP